MVIHALFILLCAVAIVVLVPALVVFLQVVSAVSGKDILPAAAAVDASPGRPTIAILMPAHNEQSIIAESIRSLLPQLSEADRLLVVADNCSDTTAAVAAAAGAEVIARQDAQHRGKGYALDFGMQHLAKAAPQVVIIVDADCEVKPRSVDRLARLAYSSLRPVQALYLMLASPDCSLKTRIAAFAWIVRNQVRPLGLWRWGLPCQLMGTGMAFPWATLSRAHLATGHLVEDRTLGIDLACAGLPPQFCPDALVTSYFPCSTEGLQSQRTRWEHGSLGIILSETPRLLKNAVTTFNPNTLALALDLSVPPLALMALLLMATWVVCTIFLIATQLALPFVLATLAGVLFTVAVFISWQRYARDVIALGTVLLAVPRAFLKVPLYLQFLVARQLDWVRSKRDQE